ncbi:DNA polymerase III subunit gamma and tau [Leucobacter sp. UCMA 4100]|uniref:DNA polymerase III subunit gamma and tau n=1 Tax=Leucobacter sp. UCMA 4100 TaxID=2810534 RepID=UPI0022EAAF38|nr:DNA polymerase III subunit gamma and tau [Leucobacter sp. UCMA 4100]MDA3147738.1 DNA polymerase III subunit gamma and tau [Leucobacter sp. UCMA 4100]
MATALYRRYRPETFAEMIGQAQVTEPLMTALRGGKVGHAYLFSGPRGCGKTTSARVLARCLNCAEGPTDTPCGVCPSCVELSRDGGGSLDVIEIDAASHGGVDDARDLRERAVFAPVRDRYKVFIIDEAHMVTKEGFNALLKIVEEPPEHVKFVFATTEPEKVIGTIRSRTHHYPFRLIAPVALLEYVQRLCAEEGITVDEGVLPLVIRAGGGSARDTLSILDQLIAGSEGNHVDYDRAVGLLGYTPDDLLDEVVTAIGAADAAAGIRSVDRVVQTGQDPRRFVEDLLERLRDLIIVQVTDIDGAAAVLRGVADEQLQRMVEQASSFGRGAISRVADVVSEALDNMTGATAPRMHLELMMARIFVTVATAPEVPAASASAHTPAPAAQPRQQAPVQRQSPAAPAPAPRPVEPEAVQEPAAQRPEAEQQAPEPQAPAPSPEPEPVQQASQPGVTAAPPQPAAAQPAVSQPPAATLSPADAIRNARAFLAGGVPAAGTPQPSATPAAASRPEPEPERTPAPTSTQSDAGVPSDAAVSQPKPLNSATALEEWPATLATLAEQNEAAASAAREAAVLGIDHTTLHLGFSDAAQLDAFKRLCAGPIRTHFQTVFGVTIGYQPWVGDDRINEGRQLFGGSAPVATVTPQEPAKPAAANAVTPEKQATEAAEQTPAPQPPAPHHESPQGGPRADEPQRDEPPHDEPPYGEPPYEAPPVDEPPYEDPGPGTGATAQPSDQQPPAQPQTQAQQAAPVTPDTSASPSAPAAPAPAPAEKPETAAVPANRNAPAFTRYGESVVREVLGAKFVGEELL